MTDYHSPLSGGGCTAYIGSTTLAMKAQRALAANAIASTVTKVNSSKARRGCAYGVSFDCSQQANVKAILSKENVPVKEFL